jgi:hypothetical protein
LLAKQSKPQSNITAIAKTATTPQPASTPTSTAVTNTSDRVLSQSTESQNAFQSPSENTTNNLPSKVFNSILYNYNGLLQDIIYGVSLIIIGILLALIFLNFHINFKKQLVFRAVLIIALLSVATLVNKEMIIAFIPHQILI